jgi:hypothetical protein
MLRQGAGLVTLQGVFDNLDTSQKLLGNIITQLVQNNWTPGKVARILGEEPAGEFYNRAFSQYDSVTEEAPLTATQKQLALQQRLYLLEMGVPIPMEDILEYVQFTDKNKTLETIQKQQQAQQQQEQAMAQAQMEAAKVDNETKLGFAAAQHATAQERLSKIRVDSAEAIQKIEAADTAKVDSFLKLILAAKQIDAADIDQIVKLRGMMQAEEQARQATDVQSQEMDMKKLQHQQDMATQQQQMQAQEQQMQQMAQQPQQGQE